MTSLGIIMVLLYFFQNKLLYIPGKMNNFCFLILLDAPNRQPSANPEGLRHPGEAYIDELFSECLFLVVWTMKMWQLQQAIILNYMDG